MFGFNDKPRKQAEKTAGPSVPTSLEGVTLESLAVEMYKLEMRVFSIEQAILQLCTGIQEHINITNQNMRQLDQNMHNLASMTLRPPKDMLGGSGSEPN